MDSFEQTIETSTTDNSPFLDTDDIPLIADGEMTELPLHLISIQENFNPRQYQFDSEMEELITDIKIHGVIQPIMVRPDENKTNHYTVVCGHRRYQACSSAGLLTIPVQVKHIDYDTALSIALAENSLRSDPSLVEESDVAFKLLSKLEGDLTETKNLLGWSLSKLKGRLLLQNCSDSVKQALIKRELSISHANIFSTMPKSIQDENLNGVIKKNITASQLKKAFEGIKGELLNVIFDKKDCSTCKFCSNTQMGMFEEIDKGDLCSSSECYHEKTIEALEKKKQDLLEEYSVVWLDSQKSADDYVVLESSKVGEEQYSACQGCAQYGALLKSEPGLEGQYEDSLCFNIPCFINKKSALIKQEENNETKSRLERRPDQDNSDTTSDDVHKESSKSEHTAITPTKVLIENDKFVRELASSAINENSNPTLLKCFSLYYLFKNISKYESKDIIGEHSKLMNLNEANFIKKAIKLDDETLDDLTLKAIQVHLLTNKDGQFNPKSVHETTRTSSTVINLLEVDVPQSFQMTVEFLSAHTKKGLQNLMNESCNSEGLTFPQWFNEKEKANKKTFSKLMGMKMDVIVNTIIKSDFNFDFLPSTIQEFMKK